MGLYWAQFTSAESGFLNSTLDWSLPVPKLKLYHYVMSKPAADSKLLIDVKKLFDDLLCAPHEATVSSVLESFGLADRPNAWKPYGDNESNYGIVENQQANAVPALVEKVTNGIDAILERRCLEEGIDPRSPNAPRSISEAIERFFPDHKHWDIKEKRREQAHDLQIVADGPKGDTSLLVYDNGVGQEPEDFPTTFMSLVRGNKNDVHFVQGRYNMGGAGAVAFCGSSRFQLVASRRFGGSKRVGFTLLRQHPLTAVEELRRRSTWYEYLFLNESIPSFETGDIDIGLSERNFESGTFIKLYSYRLPPGATMIQRDLNLSLNEYLFKPALPFLTVEKAERYPKNKGLVTTVTGLDRRLEEDDETIEDRFTLTSETVKLGKLYVRVYVFKARAREKNAKDSKSYIRNEYFKNNMSVPFSVNGQVQGHFTSEFITRTLKMNLLRDYLLIHVDCSELRTEVRNELFMASRDRLKRGDVSQELRDHLRTLLESSPLKEIEKRRRARLGADGADAAELVRNVTKRMPMNPELTKLLKQTFDIADVRPGDQNKPGDRPSKPTAAPDASTRTKPDFDPQRYPSFFNLQGGDGHEGEMTMFRLPHGGSRTIRFSTDVENRYFDRTEDPGELYIDILRPGGKGTSGGNGEAGIGRPSQALEFVTTSPSSGQIRVILSATGSLSVGDAVKIRASLSSAGEPLVQTFMVRISDAESKRPAPTQHEPEPKLGLPKLVLVSKEGGENQRSWDDMEDMGIPMSHDTVVKTVSEGDQLSDIVINMNSRAFLNFRTSLKSEEQYNFVERRYISAVYFHCLFIYATTAGLKYKLTSTTDGKEQEVDVGDYVAELFQQSYAQFLLNFDTSEIIDAIA